MDLAKCKDYIRNFRTPLSVARFFTDVIVRKKNFCSYDNCEKNKIKQENSLPFFLIKTYLKVSLK